MFPSEWDLLDGFHLEGARGDARTQALRDRIADHFCKVQALMVECLPPAMQARRMERETRGLWADCVGKLRELRNLLLDAVASGGIELPSPRLLQLQGLRRMCYIITSQIWYYAGCNLHAPLAPHPAVP